jgi:hypothetical protein
MIAYVLDGDPDSTSIRMSKRSQDCSPPIRIATKLSISIIGSHGPNFGKTAA